MDSLLLVFSQKTRLTEPEFCLYQKLLRYQELVVQQAIKMLEEKDVLSQERTPSKH